MFVAACTYQIINDKIVKQICTYVIHTISQRVVCRLMSDDKEAEHVCSQLLIAHGCGVSVHEYVCVQKV